MQVVLKFLLSPIAFALGFVWPLLTQSLLHSGWIVDTTQALIIGGVIAITFGIVAQLRGSWIWIKP